jgi:hypothetical protein
MTAIVITESEAGQPNGVATLESNGRLPENQLPSAAVSGSLNVMAYATAGVVDFVALFKAMEEQNRSAFVPENCAMKEQVLGNKAHVASGLVTRFKYRIFALGPVTMTLPTMAEGQYAFRFNQNAEGVKENSTLYAHPDIIFENINFVGSGSGDGGSVASAYNRTFRLRNCALSNLKNGFLEEGIADETHIDGLSTTSNNVTGWCYQSGLGDGKVLMNIQAYGCKGVKATHGSGVGIGWVSGTHEFTAAAWTLLRCHQEGDGPNVEHGKAQGPLITFNGGEYMLDTCDLFTLTNPSRPAFQINDSGASERWTKLELLGCRFLQCLNNPANPEKVVEPVGNLQGIAGKFVSLSTKSEVIFKSTRGQVFQQTGEESQYDVRSQIGLKFAVESTTGLEAQLEARRVMLASMDSRVRYNVSTASWEVRPVGANHDSVTTRRFSQPLLSLKKLPSGSAEAKAAPTTRTVGKHYYAVWAYDDRGRRTNLSAEQNLTLAEGEVPNIEIQTGEVCRVILLHGTEAGVFTEWVEIILPLGLGVLADMGNAIGGQEWLTAAMPTKPTTATSENNTAAGRVLLDSSGRAESWVSAVFTTGDWQELGDVLTLTGSGPGCGMRFVCIAAHSSGNGGTWVATGLSNALTSGEATLQRGETTTTALTMASGLMRLGFFTATKTQTIKHLRVNCVGAAGATPSVIELAAYAVAAGGELTLISKTANNTALLKTAGEAYEQELETSWAKVAGERYALGLIVVTSQTAPTIGGNSSSLNSSELGLAPRMCAAQSGLTEPPTSIAVASLTNSSAIPYIAAAP